MLLRFHDLVLERQSEVLDLLQMETGKSRRSAFEEVADIAQVTRHYGVRAGAYLADRRVGGMLPVLTRASVHRRPVGVVGAIAPWNYPLTLGLAEALPALVAGNAVVLKPDPQTSLTALWAAELLEEAGLPGDLFLVVAGGGDIGAALTGHVDHIAFTGSTATSSTEDRGIDASGAPVNGRTERCSPAVWEVTTRATRGATTSGSRTYVAEGCSGSRRPSMAALPSDVSLAMRDRLRGSTPGQNILHTIPFGRSRPACRE